MNKDWSPTDFGNFEITVGFLHRSNIMVQKVRSLCPKLRKLGAPELVALATLDLAMGA